VTGFAIVPAALFAANATSMAREPRPLMPRPEQRQVVAIMADCIVKLRQRDVSRAILNQVPDAEFVEDKRRFFIGRCVPSKLRGLAILVPGNLRRYALADALIRADMSLRLDQPSNIPPLDHGRITEADVNRPRWVSISEWGPAREEAHRFVAGQKIAISRFGECAVRTAPSESAALVRSKITSDAEAAALKALAPAFGSCVDQGAKVNFTPEVLRGTVALNYYRLAKAPRQLVQEAAE